jgi:hypothetical protein
MSAFRVHELGEQTAEILLCRWHTELDSLCDHILVQLLDVGNGEARFNRSRGVLCRPGMQRKPSFARDNSLQPGDSNFNCKPSTSR